MTFSFLDYYRIADFSIHSYRIHFFGILYICLLVLWILYSITKHIIFIKESKVITKNIHTLTIDELFEKNKSIFRFSKSIRNCCSEIITLVKRETNISQDSGFYVIKLASLRKKIMMFQDKYLMVFSCSNFLVSILVFVSVVFETTKYLLNFLSVVIETGLSNGDSAFNLFMLNLSPLLLIFVIYFLYKIQKIISQIEVHKNIVFINEFSLILLMQEPHDHRV